FCKRLLDGDAPRGAGRELLTPIKERLIWDRLIKDLELKTFQTEVIRSATFATAVLNLIARLKGDGITPSSFKAAAPVDARQIDLAKLYEMMEAERARLDLADFRDLVVDAVRELENPSSAARAWLTSRPPFKYVLIDEFQDSDKMQLRLLETLGGNTARDVPPTPEMCFVGDFNQSIYRFRGAAPENVEKAKTLFKCDELTLTLNRRSVQAILDVANKTPDLREESLTKADPENSRSGSVRLLRVETIGDEISAAADAVADRVRAGTRPKDVAVLLRVVEPYRGAIARELHERAIPVAAQSSAGFHEDSLIAAVLSTIAVFSGDSDADAWRRLLTNPLIGFRPLGVSLALRDGTLARTPRRAFGDNPPPGRIDWQTFAARLDACRDAGGPPYNFDPGALISAIVRDLDLLWPIRESRDVPGFDPAASPQRLDALIEAAHDIREMTAAAGERLDKPAFLSALDHVLGFIGDPYAEPESEADGVAVMSIHGAKGLEFDFVIIPLLIDGILPARVRPDPLLGSRPSTYVRSSEDAALEEYSIWYVALTRARLDVLATAARLGDDAAEQPLSALAQLIEIRETSEPIDRSDDVGFAAAYAKASEAERRAPAIARYIEERPMLDAFLKAGALADERQRGIEWPLERLSPSGIETYMRCPRSWFYRYPMHLASDDDDSTRMGVFVHEALEVYHSTANDFSDVVKAGLKPAQVAETLLPIAREAAKRVASASGLTIGAPLFRYELARVSRQLEAYSRWLIDEARVRPFTVLACEHPIEIQIGTTRLRGMVDRIDRLEDGTLAIRDYKTGKKNTAKGAATYLVEALGKIDPAIPGIGLFGEASREHKLQTFLYVRPVEAEFGSRVSRADYLYLAGTKKDRGEIEVDTTTFSDGAKKGSLSSATLDAVYDVIIAAIAREVSEGTISSFVTTSDEEKCTFCAYEPICPGAGSIVYGGAAVNTG
ncbi:MAG TPA: ATP-dependent DNA helicase, partial [Candidatus Eremiobacteraceae bacterium]|nr:ATP-dependent DNA helicase [Candidatus Eremiobacteraceae bacterium]